MLFSVHNNNLSATQQIWNQQTYLDFIKGDEQENYSKEKITKSSKYNFLISYIKKTPTQVAHPVCTRGYTPTQSVVHIKAIHKL